MKKITEYRNIVFDMGGVLVDYTADNATWHFTDDPEIVRVPLSSKIQVRSDPHFPDAMVAAFDYIVAFGVIGLAGVTRKIKNRAVAASLGAVIACILRFFCHFFSGVFVWAKGMEVWDEAPSFIGQRMLEKDVVPYTYSLIYNGGYMFPELILTVLGSAILCTVIFEAFKIDVNATSAKKLKATAEENLAEETKTEE